MNNKIASNVKGTITIVIIILFFEAFFRTVGTTTFFGVNFNFVTWVFIILAVIIWTSELKDVEWINQKIRKIFK